jgi:small subunit ribosomal protein S6
LAIYEGMFLLDSARAAKDWEGTEALVTSVLTRYGAKLLIKDRWDERKLAFPVKKQRRGTYYLAYFEAPAAAMAEIRRDLLLTEGVLRFLMLNWPEDQPVPDKIEVKRMVSDDDLKLGGRDDDGGDRRGEIDVEVVAADAEARE